MADIFLSYARADQARIEPLVAALECAGFSVWWDRDIETGASFSKTIERELTAAKAIIVAWSDAASQSEWVRDEASFAHKHNKLFPIRLDASEPPLGFQQFQAVNFSKWRGDAGAEPLQHLLRDLSNIDGQSAERNAPGAVSAPLPGHGLFDLLRQPFSIGVGVAIIAAIAGLLIFMTIGRQPDREANAFQPPLVAVLPFKLIGAEGEGALAAGLHSDILTRISKLDAIQVISQTSVVEYAETTKNIGQIGEELGAGYVLEGTVQTLDGRVRINARLIDTQSDRRLWSETFDRDLTAENLFEIQAVLAVAIANSLNITLSDNDRAIVTEIPTQNIDAYSAYLGGLALWYNKVGGVAEKRKRVALFEEAVRIDPDFALAFAHLAMARTDLAEWEDGDQNWEAARSAIEKARALKPGLIEAEIAWAYYLFTGPQEFVNALAVLESLGENRAFDSLALNLKGNVYRILGRYDDAYESMRNAQRLEPRNIGLTLDLIMIAANNNDCASAAFHTQAALALSPEFDPVKTRAAFYELSCTGNLEHANDLLKQVDVKSGFSLWIARNAAMMDRNYPRAVELIAMSHPGDGPFGPIADQLFEAGALRMLTANEDDSAALLESAAADLAKLQDDPRLAGSAGLAGLNAWRAALERDAEATQHWVSEQRRRTQEQTPEGVPLSIDVGEIWNQAMAGLHDAAINDLRTMLEAPGGRTFRFVDAHPAMDRVRDHPDYIALRVEYGDDH